MKNAITKSFFKDRDLGGKCESNRVLYDKCQRLLKTVNIGRLPNNRIAIYYGMDNNLVVGDHGGSWIHFHPETRNSMTEIYAFIRGIAHVFRKFNQY